MEDEPEDDVFTAAYLAGLPDALDTSRSRGPARPRTPAAEAVALGGLVVTPDGARRGWVRLEGGRIADIGTRKPGDAVAIQTEGVILPGLLDLHGHPEFNVFAPWEPPRLYPNRYAWRSSQAYRDLVRNPQNELIPRLPPGTQLRYAEIRALVGGVTAIQGASGRSQDSRESMVRNVDGPVLGRHRARAAIDLPADLDSRGGPQMRRVLEAIERGEVDAYYLHLAEGRRDNERSQREFAHLVALGALTPATVVIHGTALAREELGDTADAGAGLVWSPQSNLRLYGETTRAADALEVGLPMALGADWLPSGSLSLLAELKVARRELAEQGRPATAEELVAMVTSVAAGLAGLDDELGSLAPGRVADLVVLARREHDAHESVCESAPEDVQLVLIGGDVVYGRRDWVRTLAADPDDPRLEEVVAWGHRMLLDTSFEVEPGAEPTPTLAELREALTDVYPPVGPIWA